MSCVCDPKTWASGSPKYPACERYCNRPPGSPYAPSCNNCCHDPGCHSVEEETMKTPSARTTAPGHPTARPADALGATCKPDLQVRPEPASLLDRLLLAEHEAGWRDRLGAFLASALVALALVGCGVAPQDYCRTAVSATVRAVDVSMSAAGELHSAGKLSDATAWKLAAAHDTYRPIAKAAKLGCDVLDTQAAADVEIAKLQKAADEVLRGLVAAGVK